MGLGGLAQLQRRSTRLSPLPALLSLVAFLGFRVSVLTRGLDVSTREERHPSARCRPLTPLGDAASVHTQSRCRPRPYFLSAMALFVSAW